MVQGKGGNFKYGLALGSFFSILTSATLGDGFTLYDTLRRRLSLPWNEVAYYETQ